MTAVCCIDVGGTSLKVGILRAGAAHDAGARRPVLLDQRSVPTPTTRDTDGGETVRLVVDLVAQARASHDIDGAGVVVPGIVNETNGMALWSTNLGWRDVPFRQRLRDAIDLPVAFGHDVRAGALAEARLGAARGSADSVFLPIGTGIAAGSLIGGHALAGRGWAGEVGHADVGHGEPCACGLTGCLEAVASAAAIARRYSQRTGQQVASAAEVARRARGADEIAQAVWTDAINGLAFEIAQIARLVAPEVVVIGGGLAKAGDQLLAPLKDSVSMRLGPQPSPRIVAAELGDQAGCIGAGLLALDLLDARSGDGSESTP